jgi:ADP-ribose pyrophosphatase YjhB (NUDIX family)
MEKDTTKIKIGVLVEKNNKLLLIKELNSSNGKYYWNIIKGTFESTRDKDFFKTAKRECKEEAGIEIKLIRLINVIYLNKKYRRVIQFNFIALIKKGIPRLLSKKQHKIKNEDIIEIKFFTKNEIKKIKKSEFIDIRAFLTVRDWLGDGKKGLEIFKFINQ